MNSTELNRTDANYDRYALMIRIGWLFAFIMFAVVVYRWWYPYQIFDSKAWKAADRTQSKTRLGMATYLVESQTLIGKTKAEVFNLLGQPDDMKHPADTHHTWNAGPGFPFC